MDLIPTPDQVVSAAANLAHKVVRGRLADLRPMPRTLVDEGVLREVYHYRARPGGTEHGDPVLLVSPLAAPATCFDLRRGCSLVEHLVGSGRPTYLVEYGEVSFANRGLGIEHWVTEVVPRAVEEVSRHAGGRPVHVVGWSLGAIFALLAAADRPDLPIASLTTLGAPVDVTQVPLVAPFKPFLGIAGERAGLVSHAHRLLGGVPMPLVGRAFQLSAFNRLVTRPIAIAAKLDDADFLAQVEAVDRFTAHTSAYPGRTYGALFHRLLTGSGLAGGTATLDGRRISLTDLTVPLLVLAGAADAIAPVDCVRAVTDLVPGVEEVRFEIVPGGHLGMLTGRAARRTTWPVIDEWLLAHSPTDAPARGVAVKKTATRPRRTASSTAIGSNPDRRYGSASSRTLAAQ